MRLLYGKEMDMEEKIYKTLNHTGAWSIAMGVVSLVVGLCVGIGCLVSGSILLKNKSQIMF